ncbi:MAG TPA: DNA-formamidopyrimidine glycosylase family protein [Euzebyales bacterium]|nr:DNA-formamidopyrimidine glycosylase family protein [Euzebyales bacterium]
MTYLPEVEVIRKELEKDVQGKRFKDINVKSANAVVRHRNRPEFYKALDGRRIEALTRRGRLLLFELDEDQTLVVSLGSRAVLTRESANVEAGPDTQFTASFTTGGALHLVDPAKDGELFVVPTAELETVPELSTGGIDALADTFTWHAFAQELVLRQQLLALLLRDETFILGLGDLYADEILWAAGLSGLRSSQTLTSQEVRRLYRAIFEVLYEAVKQGGIDVPEDDLEEDEEAEYGEFVKVYDRAGEQCPRCRRPIVVVEFDQGATMFSCSGCQT